MQVPLVSICIPVYNGADFISDAIVSAISQTYTNIEIIVIDNKSTDCTVDIVRSFQDDRIRLVLNETNVGAVANFNKCLKEATGKYVKLLLADDLIYPECVEKQVSVLELPGHEGVVMACCKRDIFFDSGRRLMRRGFLRANGVLCGCSAIRKSLRSGGNLIGEPSAVLVRSSLLREVEGFRESTNFVVDLDLWCRLLLKGDIYISQEALCGFRVRNKSWSATMANQQFHDFHQYLRAFRHQEGCRLSVCDYLTGSVVALLSQYGRSIIYKVFTEPDR